MESIIRVAHARFYSPKWDNTVASCLVCVLPFPSLFAGYISALRGPEALAAAAFGSEFRNRGASQAQLVEAHYPIFREAVAQTEEEVMRRARARVEEEERGEEHTGVPVVVPTNTASWKELMADQEVQEFIKARQCRLMKVIAWHPSGSGRRSFPIALWLPPPLFLIPLCQPRMHPGTTPLPPQPLSHLPKFATSPKSPVLKSRVCAAFRLTDPPTSGPRSMDVGRSRAFPGF